MKNYFLILFLLLALDSFAQVTFTFDQETENVNIRGKWKVGKEVKIVIDNYSPGTFNYRIVYSSSERVNEKGVDLFNQLHTAAVKTTDKSLLTGNLLYSQVIIDNKDFSHINITKFDGSQIVSDRQFKFIVKGGLKFDVSTGAIVSHIKDDDFILVNEGDSNRIVAENSGNFTIGAGVIAHLHTRNLSAINWGPSLGFQVNNESKVGYLLGISVLLGLEQKFVFTLGIAGTKKLIISDAYKDEKFVHNSLTEVPRTNIWEAGIFGAATYNF